MQNNKALFSLLALFLVLSAVHAIPNTITLLSTPGRYNVIVDPSNGDLVISSNQPSVFNVVPQTGDNVALQYVGTDKYVTADNAGASALTAAASTPDTWELFQFVLTDASSNQYAILAVINNHWVTLQSQTFGSTFIASTPNNGSLPTADNTKFYFGSVPAPPPSFKLQSVSNGNYIVVDPTTTDLLATGTVETAAVFAQISEGDTYAFRYGDQAHGQFVSSNGGSTTPLTANRNAASSWEYFNFANQNGILANANSEFVTVQPDNTFQANTPPPTYPAVIPVEAQFNVIYV